MGLPSEESPSSALRVAALCLTWNIAYEPGSRPSASAAIADAYRMLKRRDGVQLEVPYCSRRKSVAEELLNVCSNATR